MFYIMQVTFETTIISNYYTYCIALSTKTTPSTHTSAYDTLFILTPRRLFVLQKYNTVPESNILLYIVLLINMLISIQVVYRKSSGLMLGPKLKNVP